MTKEYKDAQFGKKFYSKYLGCECVVVKVLADNNWYFVAKNHSNKIMKAGTVYSYFFGEE